VIFSNICRDIADERLRPIQKRFVLDEAHRYITDPAFSHWIALLARTGEHWNIMLDLITQSLADLDNPDQPWSKAIITNQGYHLSDLRDPSSASQSAIRRRPAFSVASFNRWPMLNVWPTRAFGSNPGHAAAPVLSV